MRKAPIGLALLAWGMLAYAAEAERHEPRVPPEIRKLFTEWLADPNGRERASAIAKVKLPLCNYCHGDDGNSVKRGVPKLAGQNPWYLIEQVESFLQGRRKHFGMRDRAARLSDQERMALVIYFTSQPLEPAQHEPELAEQGRELYAERCEKCHGPAGRGEKGYAYLAGQRPEYVAGMLIRFRDEPALRRNARMEDVALDIADHEADAIAHYVAAMGHAIR